LEKGNTLSPIREPLDQSTLLYLLSLKGLNIYFAQCFRHS